MLTCVMIIICKNRVEGETFDDSFMSGYADEDDFLS